MAKTKAAKDVFAKCGDGYAMVYAKTYADMKDNYSNNTLLKAVDSK